MNSIHLVDVIKPPKSHREVGRLIDSYVVPAADPEAAVEAVKRDLKRRQRDVRGTKIVHRRTGGDENVLIVDANRPAHLGLVAGILQATQAVEVLA